MDPLFHFTTVIKNASNYVVEIMSVCENHQISLLLQSITLVSVPPVVANVRPYCRNLSL